MIKIGDYVTHIGFPPAEGIVVGVQELNTVPESYKLCVRLDCGRLQWDNIENWTLQEENTSIENIEDIIDAEYIECDVI